MADANTLNVSVDVVWPTIIVLAMLVINGFVFAYIMRKRREFSKHLSEEHPHTSYAATSSQAVVSAPLEEPEDDSCAIQMERL
ncbi:uncharacterized protein [Drosophila kikkawai]|uniref:Uncharacterized protein n=1 Tax=Drosophila kikkawai TaxID=30033 RepID=A0A6P4JN97_DROKI|nr:uncharacterized protein LOC108085135 [Drosophila kikkawai]KAH8253280.1 hypothetical protein KR032_004571 [Drosophila birchii]KAH8309307.1 hypothetical protein KR059_008036 [Drosophila kikkawai]